MYIRKEYVHHYVANSYRRISIITYNLGLEFVSDRCFCYRDLVLWTGTQVYSDDCGGE